MGLIKEFKNFALKGNVIDLAVAVIIGGAFGTIVSSLVEDVITPLLLTPALKAAKVEDLEKLTLGAIKYGKFIAAIIKFIVIAFVLFLLIKLAKNFDKTKPAAPSSTDKLLMEIRDELKNKQG
jgi:large conductance mechanosensitive channel